MPVMDGPTAAEKIRCAAERIDAIDTVAAAALGDAITALQELDNAMATMSAAQGHKMETNIDLWTAIEDVTNTATLVANLKAYMQASDDFLVEHLGMADEAVIKSGWDKMTPETKSKILRVIGRVE